MVTIITDDIVAFAYHHGNDALVYRETGRETKTIILMNILGDFLFQLNMQVERSIEETTAGTSRAIFIKGFLGFINNTLIAC